MEPKGVNAQGATSDNFVARVKLSFRKILNFYFSDKILNFYNFMRALLRQATILSLVAPCAFKS